MRKNSPNAEFFWSVCSGNRTEYGDLPSKSVQIRENTDQKNSVFGHFSQSELISLVIARKYSSFEDLEFDGLCHLEIYSFILKFVISIYSMPLINEVLI